MKFVLLPFCPSNPPSPDSSSRTGAFHSFSVLWIMLAGVWEYSTIMTSRKRMKNRKKGNKSQITMRFEFCCLVHFINEMANSHTYRSTKTPDEFLSALHGVSPSFTEYFYNHFYMQRKRKRQRDTIISIISTHKKQKQNKLRNKLII